MSTVPLSPAASQTYKGLTGYIEESDKREYQIREREHGGIMVKDTMAAEIVGLSITGILSLVGLCVSLAINYSLLSLLFVIPLIGVAIGFSYMAYMRKHG
jgi:hypothetical protein